MTFDRTIKRACALFAGLAGFALASAAGAQGLPPPPSVPGAEAASEAEAPRRTRQRRAEIRPYLEVGQVVSTDLDGGDVFTYTSVAAGVDGRVVTRRVTAQMSYRYERRIAWNGDLADQDLHTGVAQVGVVVVPGLLNVEAGALAARTAGEGRALGVTDRDAAVNVYSAYAGPSLSTRVGPVAVNAGYRLGYVAVDDDTGAPGIREDYDDAVAHSANASAGMAPGRLPVGWTVGAGYVREESGDLDHVYEGKYVRGDVVLPVSPTLAVTAGVGYENIEASQQDIARTVDGMPIIGPDGRLVGDPSRPRLLTYDLDGIIYDAGIIWRPSARTELQARAGHRYGGTTVVASFRHQFNRDYGIRASVYDGVQTFGRILVNDLSELPDDFQIDPNPLTGDLGLGGCVFGADPGTGICFDDTLQSISGGAFRHRGANIIFSGVRGPWSFGAGAGYAHRRYGRPSNADPLLFERRTDESISLYGTLERDLSRTSAIGFDVTASWFDSDLATVDGIFSTGLTASYRRSFLFERLQLLAAFGIYHNDLGDEASSIAAGRLGLRYTF